MKAPQVTRVEKILRRQHRLLRCEWCNRFTSVSKGVWLALLSDAKGNIIHDKEEALERIRKHVFECKREDCIQRYRPEMWWTWRIKAHV